MNRPAFIGFSTAALAFTLAVSASCVGVARADEAPVIGQAPAIGQAPEVGQAPPTASSSAPAAAPQAGDKPVSFSADQATRGQVTFTRVCVDCHGEDLRGGLNGGPPLRGNAFEAAYESGSPVSGLFSFISTAMPPDSPGQFSPDVYAELTAYILQQNGFQPGAPLPTDPDAQDHLIVQK